MKYKQVICVGTIWDLDDFAYPELEEYSTMTRWNYLQIMRYQPCSSRKEMKNIVKLPLFPRNQHGIRVRACCASCMFKKVIGGGNRICTLRRERVESLEKCKYWQMSSALMKAGKITIDN